VINAFSKTFRRIGLTLLWACIPVLAQNPRLQIQSLDKLASKASEVVDVTLDASTIKLASRFLDNDPETKSLVQGLKGIFVRVLEFDKPDGYAKADVDAIRTQLQTPDWSRIVSVHDKKDGEQVEVYLMTEGGGTGNTLGMAIIAMEAKELTVVNIVGAIDIQKLSALQGKLGIPKLDLGKGVKKAGEPSHAKN
jgi:hypothetical protein